MIFMSRRTLTIPALALAIVSYAHPPAAAGDQTLPEPAQIHVAEGLSDAGAQALLATAQEYYAFWDTGDPAFAKRALSPDFIDLTLPDGRAQGPSGPIEASEGFRKAVPDLSVDVGDVYILGNTVISQLHFSGHFTSQFGEMTGDGREIAFRAIDTYTIKDGQITENWHLEDNLTLMQQLGVIGTD